MVGKIKYCCSAKRSYWPNKYPRFRMTIFFHKIFLNVDTAMIYWCLFKKSLAKYPSLCKSIKNASTLKNDVCISFTLCNIFLWNVHIAMIFLLLSSIGTNRKLLSRNLYSWNEFENLSPRVYFTSRKLFKKHVEYYGFCCRRYGVSFYE